jgi:hypothetical protein
MAAETLPEMQKNLEPDITKLRVEADPLKPQAYDCPGTETQSSFSQEVR